MVIFSPNANAFFISPLARFYGLRLQLMEANGLLFAIE